MEAWNNYVLKYSVGVRAAELKCTLASALTLLGALAM
jgi:hypothetical protein